ncbi:MAG: RNA-binding domain-containing protein, partial [bacterium]
MPLDLARVRRCLKDCDLATLFTQELGWEHHHANLTVTVDGTDYSLAAVAHKRGMVAYHFPSTDIEVPNYPTRRRIERQLTRSVHEHVIVFTDAGQELQVWQWVKREAGRPAACREHRYHVSQPGDALIQKLAAIEFTLEEEEGLTIVDVAGKTKAAFDVDKVTKRFYDRFKTEHTAFLEFIKGIPAEDDREWYASLMLNRLMFVYFIQKKGFLDGDTNYLRNRLEMMRKLRGKDKFLSFYRHFLLRLFHEGLGSQERTTKLDALMGTVPYLDGGLFDVHELERQNSEIAIPDKAFEKLFDFFDTYQWHLDERPLRNDNEINPDVLGYIFEKYINQKQMGAYYTKEDITDYIAKNTVLPFLFDAAEKKCAVAFEPDSALWSLLRDDPDRYIYPAIRHGVVDDSGNVIPLPAEIAVGLDDVSKRTDWNRPADARFSLPTETWREYVARRRRCLELREKLAAGEVHQINDLITLNLDICRFAQDAIENCEGPELLRAFYSTIAGRLPAKSNEHFEQGISILDPTCGSGAFLFAALNILEPLHDACLERMARFLEEADQQVSESVEEAVKTVVAAGESTTAEFKSTARWNIKAGKQDKAMEGVIVKTVAAMLNTKGGVLLIGVEDDGTILGLKCDYKTWGKHGDRDAFENWLITRLSDQFGRDCAALVAIDFCSLKKKDVCRVVVQPSPTAVYVKEGKDQQFFMRAGNSTRQLTAQELVKYHKQRFEGEKPAAYVPPTQRQQYAGPAKHRKFRRILDSVAEHPNQRYFILKSIIIGNLFGVDIMEEAVEICKLRLFLKLVAQVESVDQIEPLPDIDFNIRAGNTLVGYTSLNQVRNSVKSDLGLVDERDEKALAQIEEDAEVASWAFKQFRQMQNERDMD